MTIALRVPTFENVCGPVAGSIRNAAMSSSLRAALRFGPVKKSRTGTRRVPDADASSTSASDASRGGCASPAGDAVPRLPPTVPRLRICGEPTVRDAMANPGMRSPSSSMIRVYVTPAPTRTRPSSVAHSARSATRVKSITVSGRLWSRSISTSTSVPPAIGSASGCAAFIARASAHVDGWRKFIPRRARRRVLPHA